MRGYLVGLALMLASLAVLPNIWWMQWLTIFMVSASIHLLEPPSGKPLAPTHRSSPSPPPSPHPHPTQVGFFLYGPQMLIGLCGAELVGRDSVGASEGFLGWIAYLGAAAAGYPLSLLVKQCGWPVFFQTLGVTCAVAFLLLSTIGNAKSFTQREADVAAAK